MDINKREYYANLFDKYKDFLTKNQRPVLQIYLFEDVSIAEISQELAMSRQAIYDFIKKGIRKLDEIDSKIEKNL